MLANEGKVHTSHKSSQIPFLLSSLLRSRTLRDAAKRHQMPPALSISAAPADDDEAVPTLLAPHSVAEIRLENAATASLAAKELERLGFFAERAALRSAGETQTAFAQIVDANHGASTPCQSASGRVTFAVPPRRSFEGPLCALGSDCILLRYQLYSRIYVARVS